jgi:hypothetical protein
VLFCQGKLVAQGLGQAGAVLTGGQLTGVVSENGIPWMVLGRMALGQEYPVGHVAGGFVDGLCDKQIERIRSLTRRLAA